MKNVVMVMLFGSIVLIHSADTIAQELLRTKTSWDGGAVVYPKGPAEITSVKLHIKAGQTTPFHCHPIPTLGYVLKGDIEVETKQGKKTLLHQGQSAVEVMKTLHRGKAIGGATELIVFYAGAESIPNTVLESSELAKRYCGE